MNVYDKAHETARILKETSQYKLYLEARDNLQANEKSWQMMKDFRSKQTELQAQILSGEEPLPEKIGEINSLMEIVTQSSDAVNFMQAEMELIRVVEEIQRIIIQALDVDITKP